MNENIRIDLIMKENQLLKLKNDKSNANIDYLSMMTGIDIPTEEEQLNE